ncbi:MAG TPA: hypothetical protein VIV60_27105 [Polyangiaceae bacterium]
MLSIVHRWFAQSRIAQAIVRLLRRCAKLEPALYLLFAAFVTLTVARRFYASEFWQLNHAMAWSLGDRFDVEQRESLPKIWSAPLDDVFIHFDFARSAARGMPFQWIDGNGYSSGGTSLLYPLVLALGTLAGFRGLTLMHFAAMLAATSVFGLLWGLRRAFDDLPRPLTYLLPIGLLSIGALDWSLFSGMEVAFFLAVWVLGFLSWDALVRSLAQPRASLVPGLLGLASSGALIIATRPEALSTIAVLALDAAIRVQRQRGWRSAFNTLCAASLPAGLVFAAQAMVNRLLTGDASAAGALVKLELNNPLLTSAQIVDAYGFHLKYQILRVTEYHFSNNPITGWLAWGLAFVSLIPKATRRFGIVLWLSLIGWLLTVSLNGQVRWQNERYTMPAVAWLLTAATLGCAALLSRAFDARSRYRARVAAPLIGVAAASVFIWFSRPTFRDQCWFFGRAARNIFDQHIQTGHLLRMAVKPTPHRVLVGDAGAMTYVSDLPGLDIIGLGGTFQLPFARASQWGVGASIELIQHLPTHERPDYFAIYPSWWSTLPLWFTSDMIAAVPVRGNVICGGASKVVYRADFSSLDDAERPISIRHGEHVIDFLDFADVESERSHGFRLSERAAGFVDMKKLAHPENPERDLWDAGRISHPGLVERFKIRGLVPGKPARLLLRVAPVAPAKLGIESERQPLGELSLTPSDSWNEVSFELPMDVIANELPLEVHTIEGGPTLYFLWVLQSSAR